MNNDLEFNSQNVKNVEDNLKNIFLKLILNDIPENKRNAIKYLNNMILEIDNKSEDLYGTISNSICKKIITDIINELDNLKYNSRLNIKQIIRDKINEDINFNLEDTNDIEFNDSEEDIDEEIERLKKKKKQKIDKDFLNLIKSGDNSISNDVKYFSMLEHNDKINYVNNLNNLSNDILTKPYLLQLADLNTTEKNKKIILNKINTLNNLEKNSGEYCKLNNWVRDVLKIPFGNFTDITEGLSTNSKKNSKINDINNILNETIYGHKNAKNKILQYCAELMVNKNDIANIITLEGPPGIGKTALIQNGVANAFSLPFNFISLGGATDSSNLEGFDYTYEGSTYGKIVDILIRSKCMNPIIYFDELDKVSDTPKGEEIMNILTHITDGIQNNHFNDKYFTGIDIDLSKVLFIFSCNDLSRVNHILQDRMYIINLNNFSLIDKYQISNNYILPKLYKKFNFENKIIFNEDIIKYIINTYTYEGGVRKLKEKLYEILQEINLRKIKNVKINNRKIKYPLKINKDIVDDFFSNKQKINFQKINKEPKVGIIMGLWACDYGVGGIAPIEVAFSYSNEKLSLELTGSQGEVMQESMKVAKSVALNLLSNLEMKKLLKNLNDSKLSGLHIHCPDGATPIDGPSAGCAIAIGIYSLFTNKPINNTIAITGELNLQGEITEIGGLKQKIYGALNAGIKTLLYPEENDKQLKKILVQDPNIKDSITFYKINNIKNAIEYIF